ncbi:hypothetical protein ACWCXE_27180 [Streptomyces sp. NPDC001780]
MPGIDLTPAELGEIGYTAYAESTGGLNVRSEQLPAWADLGETVQTAWAAAGVAVARAVTPAQEEEPSETEPGQS